MLKEYKLKAVGQELEMPPWSPAVLTKWLHGRPRCSRNGSMVARGAHEMAPWSPAVLTKWLHGRPRCSRNGSMVARGAHEMAPWSPAVLT